MEGNSECTLKLQNVHSVSDDCKYGVRVLDYRLIMNIQTNKHSAESLFSSSERGYSKEVDHHHSTGSSFFGVRFKL